MELYGLTNHLTTKDHSTDKYRCINKFVVTAKSRRRSGVSARLIKLTYVQKPKLVYLSEFTRTALCPTIFLLLKASL